MNSLILQPQDHSCALNFHSEEEEKEEGGGEGKGEEEEEEEREGDSNRVSTSDHLLCF